MLVTVVVLVYQNMNMLEATIRGVVCQDYDNIELIVSDDGSEEFVVEEVFQQVEQLCKGNQSIHVDVRKNKENLGIVKHINKVFSEAKGEIIIPSSCGDVLYAPDTIHKIVNHFKQHEELLVTAKRMCYVHNSSETKIMPTLEQCQLLEEGGSELIDALCKGNFIPGACTYYSQKLFKKYGYFDERMFLIEDYPMYLRLLFRGEKIGFLDCVTVKYESSGVSAQGKKSNLFMKDMDMIYQTVIIPNRKYIDRKTFRLLECRHIRDTKRGINRILGILKYPDVIIQKVSRCL